MSFSRTSRRAAACFLLLFAATLTGCIEDVPPPTQAEVTLQFASDALAVSKGSRVSIDDLTVTDSLATAELKLLLDAGSHTIVVRKECVEVIPAETLRVVVRGGEPMTVPFSLRQRSGLLVDSDPPGLAVWLDDRPTGEITPASLPCVTQGDHAVRVSPSRLGTVGFTTSGDTIKSVSIGEEAASVRFDLGFAPEPQARGVLFEIFTSTFCPSCGPADQAASNLERDEAFDARLLSIVQVHLWWMGFDPLFNDELGARADYYRIEPSTSPHAIFNGTDKVTGTSYPDIEATYRARIRNTYATPGAVGLYWIDPRVEGNLIKGRLRFVAIEDLTGYLSLELRAFYAKDSLRITDPDQNPNDLDFVQGARDYSEPIDLAAAGVVSAGSHLDVDIVFDMEPDVLPSFVVWDAGALRLVAYVQDNATNEILQCRQAALKLP